MGTLRLVIVVGVALITCSDKLPTEQSNRPDAKDLPQKPDTELKAKWQKWLMEEGTDHWAEYAFDHRNEVTPLLIEWAGEAESPLRQRAISALGSLATQRLIRKQPVGDGEGHLKVLIAGLADKDPAIRRSSAAALAYCRGAAAVPPLIKAMADKEESVRIYATDAVGHHHDKRALRPLLAALVNDPSPAVRNEAADAVWQFKGEKGVLEALVQALFDPASGTAAGNIRIALERLEAKVVPIQEAEGVKRITVGYRVKLSGENKWQQRRWPREQTQPH